LHSAHGAAWEEGARDGWVLVGTLVSPLHAKAVFQHANGSERILIQGDAIADCTIDRIDTRYVTVICRDQQMLIPLDYAQTESENFARSSVQDSTTRQSYSISRTRLVELVQDRQRLISQISFVPEIKDDTMTGYRVSQLRPDGDLSDFGLRNEDVITAVNGTPANQPDAFVEAVNASSRMRVINVEVERGDRLVTINYVLD